VSRRIHRTAMASLILHGDRNEPNATLSRPLYVRPLMVTNQNGQGHTDRDRLLIDTIYRAVLRIKGEDLRKAVRKGLGENRFECMREPDDMCSRLGSRVCANEHAWYGRDGEFGWFSILRHKHRTENDF
jgi:hypothetical protein